MGYRQALVLRWSRRDRLAVLAVAVTVAFLTGTTLFVLAAGTQTASIAAEFETPGGVAYHDSLAAADRAARGDADAVVLPVARVTDAAGETLVVGVPPGADRGYGRADRTLRGNAAGTTLGSRAPGNATLAGADRTLTVPVSQRRPSSSLLAPSWYAANATLVDRLGATGAFVVDASPAEAAFTPLLGALAFFLRGTEQALRALVLVAAGGGLLVGVTVYSVSRMSVRDRTADLRVVRATGGGPATVLWLFTARAALLTGVGVALGYAVGLVLAKAVVNASVAAGLPTSLSVGVSGRALGVLVPLYAAVLAVGAVAGLLAARPAVRVPPAHLSRTEGAPTTAAGRPGASGREDGNGSARNWGGDANGTAARLRDLATPALLDWRALVPTTATVTAFVAFVALVAAMAGAAGPVVDADGATVTEPGAAHPVSSQVPAAYADALRGRGIDASAEILLFEVVDGEPVPARGASYRAFANVTDARLVEGRAPAPNATAEAVVGEGLARTLGVGAGDAVTVGGSTQAAIARVEVVGVFAAPGATDDQLVVPLGLARHLSPVRAGRANLVRADRLPRAGGGTGSDGGGSDGNGGLGVVDVGVDGPVAANASFAVRVTVRNDGLLERRATVPVRFAGQERRVAVTVRPGRERTRSVQFSAGSPGDYRLVAGTVETRVTVADPDALRITGVAEPVPPGSEPLVRVVTATGDPVAGARVSVGDRTATTGGDGFVRVPFGTAGTARVVARAGDRSARTRVTVAANATRMLETDLGVRPRAPSLLTRPTARLTLFNPWNETRRARVTLAGPGTAVVRNVTLAPGGRTRVSARLDQRPPGRHEVVARVDGRTAERVRYRVTGDERIVAALASGGRERTTGLGRALEVAFGNLQLVLGALVLLAGVMTVGGTTATFAQAVHARRRTLGIHRAVGADPVAVVRLVLGDALRIGAVATALALALGFGALAVLERAGYLTVFGVRLSVAPDPLVVSGIVAGSLAVTLLGAGVATLRVVTRPPAGLLAGDRADPGQRETSDGPETPAGSDGPGWVESGGRDDD